MKRLLFIGSAILAIVIFLIFYMDIYVIPVTWTFLARQIPFLLKYATRILTKIIPRILAKNLPRVILSTVRGSFFNLLQKLGLVAILSPKLKRNIEEKIAFYKRKTEEQKEKILKYYNNANTWQKILVFSIPLVLLVILAGFFGFLWIFIVPLIGVPNSLLLWIRGYIVKILGKLGITQMVMWVYSFIPEKVRNMPEKVYIKVKIWTFRRIIKLRHKTIYKIRKKKRVDNGQMNIYKNGNQ